MVEVEEAVMEMVLVVEVVLAILTHPLLQEDLQQLVLVQRVVLQE
jgi:hypothetical protein